MILVGVLGVPYIAARATSELLTVLRRLVVQTTKAFSLVFNELGPCILVQRVVCDR